MQIMMIGKRSMYRVSAALSLFLVIHPVHRVLVSSYAPLIVHQHILPVAVRVILPAVVRVIPTQGDLAQLPAAVRVILTRVLLGIGSVPIQALLPNPMALRVRALLPDLPHREAVRAQVGHRLLRGLVPVPARDVVLAVARSRARRGRAWMEELVFRQVSVFQPGVPRLLSEVCSRFQPSVFPVQCFVFWRPF